MASEEVWELCDKLRAERLLIASELQSLKDLHTDVNAKQIKHGLLSWKSCQLLLISHRLLSSHRLVSPDNTCSLVSQLEDCEPLEAYKRFGHHYSNITRILITLYKNPLAVAEFISADAPHNVATEDLVYSVVSLVFGNGSYPTDEKHLLEVLKHLIKVQLTPANNPRLILRKGNSAFPRLYKLFSESLFSVKIFLTSALHEAVMHVLCQDDIFLDIDPSKSPQRFPAAERARRFGTDPSNPQYHKRLLAHRKIIVEKLVLLAHGFIKAITDALCCFPECLVWLVQEMYQSLVANQRMSEAEAHLICTDLIVTNLLCPAITNPENVGVISDTPVSHIARFNLMQIGQIIQTLALSRYEAAPPHFQTFTTQFCDSPICSIVDTLLGRECQDVEKFYPTVLSETNGEEMLKRPHFIGSLWEVNNLIAVLQTDAVSNISSEEVKQELLACSNKLPASFSSAGADISSSSNISPHIPRQNRLKNFADRVHNSLSQSPTRANGGNRVVSSSTLPAELFDVVIFDLPQENELTGLLPEDKFMENKINNKKLFESRKKRTRFVEDDSVVGSAVSDITADNASDLEEEAAAQDEVGSVSSSQEAPQEDRMLILDEDAESTLPDNVSDVGGISGRGSPSLSGRDTPLSQGPRDVVDNIAVSLASGAGPDDFASRDLRAISVALKKSNAEGLEEKFGKFNVPTGTLGSCKDDQRSILSEAWSTNVVASDDEGNAAPSGRALLAQLPVDGYSNRQRPINRAGSMTGATEDRSDTWSLDAVASDSEVDGKEKQRNTITQDQLPAIVTHNEARIAPLIDISLPSSNDMVSERRRSSGSSFSYARSDADSETGRPNDYQNAQISNNQDYSNADRNSAGDSTTEEVGSNTGSRQSDISNSEDQSGSKRRSGIIMGLQRVGDKVRKGITNTPLRQLPQSSTISDFFGDLREKRKGLVSQSFSTNQLSELDPRTADDILAKYQRPGGSSELSPNMSPPLEMAPELPNSESGTVPYYDAENVMECRAFLDAKRKLRLVLSSVGNLFTNRISDNNGMRPERDQLNVVLRTLLAEAVNSRQQVLSAHVREVMRCLQIFDNKGIHLLLRTLGDEHRQRACYISYLQQSRLSLLRLISYEEQLTLQVERQKILTEECLTDVLIRFYLENKDNQLRRFLQEFSQLHAQDEKIECLNRTLNALFARLPTAPMWKDVTPAMKEYLHKALERVVMFQIHGMAFYPNHEADRHRDEVLHKALVKLSRSITPDHPMLRIPKVLHGESPWPSAQAEINILNAYKSARDKLACVVRCCEIVSNLVTMAGTGAAAADDVTPVLVYVLIQANPPALLSNVQYIQSFGGTLLNGVEGYWWTQFVAAIEFIKTLL